MKLQQTNYKDIRKNMQSGDVLAFGGTGLTSGVIKFGTTSNVSHVATVLHTSATHDLGDRYFNNIIESTSLDGGGGVAIRRLSDVINAYDGDVWWLPLSEDSRRVLNLVTFFDFLLKQVGKEYDLEQAIKSALDTFENIPFLKYIDTNDEDFTKLFCSELIAGGFEAGKLLHFANASEFTPIDVCNLNVYTDTYYQIKGEPKELKG